MFSTKNLTERKTKMDLATIRDDQNGLSSVANMRQKREERKRDQAEIARRQRQAEDGKRRTETVAVGLSYSSLFKSYRDQ